jgi:dTDP-4-amino-4,6-dideoxygalactose transaminase
LESAERIQSARRHRWERYRAELAGWAAGAGVRLPTVPDWCSQSYHLFYLRMPSLERRTALIRHARERGVQCAFHYQPLHLSEMGLRYGGRAGDCPVTEAAADDLVRLPLYFNLTDDQQDRVIDAVTSFPPRRPARTDAR